MIRPLDAVLASLPATNEILRDAQLEGPGQVHHDQTGDESDNVIKHDSLLAMTFCNRMGNQCQPEITGNINN